MLEPITDGKRPYTIVSVDMEATGPACPPRYSMLSLGAVAYNQKGQEIDTFYRKLHELPGAGRDPDTMVFWQGFPDAWKEARKFKEPPELVTKDFVAWAEKFPNPTMMCYPAGYDFTWVYWYMMRFVGRSPFGFVCIDFKSVAATILGRPYRSVAKRNMPKEWFKGCDHHDHTALTDARGQGMAYFNMLAWAEAQKEKNA